jgi:hypothetical protein
LFRDWQEITNSIFCGERSWLQQQMDVWFCILQEPPPRGNNRELKDLEKLFHALLLSASGELLPLSRNSRYAAGASMIFNPKLAAFRLRELICRQRCCAS